MTNDDTTPAPVGADAWPTDIQTLLPLAARLLEQYAGFMESDRRPMIAAEARGLAAALASAAREAADDDDATSREQYKRMFHAACADLGAINEALGLDPDDGGAEPILTAIEGLKARAALASAAQPASIVLDEAEAQLDAMRKIAYILVEECDPVEAASCIEMMLSTTPAHLTHDMGKLLDEVQHGNPEDAADRARQLVCDFRLMTLKRTEPANDAAARAPTPIGADARKAAEALIRAAELDWPSTPRHRAAVLNAAADLRAALASAAPAAQGDARHPLTEGQIRDWWRSDNGLEECDLCKFEDFAKVVHAVEARAAKEGAPDAPR